MTFERLLIRGPPILYRNNLVHVDIHKHAPDVPEIVTASSFLIHLAPT